MDKVYQLLLTTLPAMLSSVSTAFIYLGPFLINVQAERTAMCHIVK